MPSTQYYNFQNNLKERYYSTIYSLQFLIYLSSSYYTFYMIIYGSKPLFYYYFSHFTKSKLYRLLDEHKGQPEVLNIDCTDPLNRSALITAIENENMDLIQLLLKAGIKVKDALLHAIKEEYVEAVELLLEWEEKIHVVGEPYVSSWKHFQEMEVFPNWLSEKLSFIFPVLVID